MPTGSLALMIKRGAESILTRGDTIIRAGDDLILSVTPYDPSGSEELEERVIEKEDEWCNRAINELKISGNQLIAMIIRDAKPIIPDGSTIIREKDVIVFISVTER